MEFTKGMRDKLENYFDLHNEIEIKMDLVGKAIYDFCCFGVDENNQLSDEDYMIFYNQTETPQREIKLSYEKNKGIFKVNLNGLPQKINKLVFTISIDGRETISEMEQCQISLFQSGAEQVSYKILGKDLSLEKSIITIEIYKKSVWRLAAVGNGFNGGLASLLSYFGGAEDKQKKNDVKVQNINAQTKKVTQIENSYAKNNTKHQKIHETIVLNNKVKNGTRIYFKYNPYLVESEIQIDGVAIQPPNKLHDLRNERIQVWIEKLMPILIDICNDSAFEITFYGLLLDYEDLLESVSEYCKEHSNISVQLSFIEAKGSDDRLSELKTLFLEMQRQCPFEDLKTKQIQENFNNALSSEFEVSVIATMSSGKSTLINSLLGRELMPSKNEACTATIAKIKDCKENEYYTAKYRDKENKVLGQYNQLTLNDMEEMNANPNTAYIDIEGNIPNIDSSGIKLVLVDTPGPNNSRTEEHKNHTYKVIKEKTKPMVLYVLNATQLQTNDDYQLLSTVAEAMKIGGKQSKDRFIFAVNKIDQFDPDKESVQGALEHVKEYLKKFDIVNPNIFPTSAEMAKVIRLKQSGVALTKGQTKTLGDCDFFIKEQQMHLSEQASLSNKNLEIIKEQIEAAKSTGDKYQEVLLYSGVPAVELAINEYLKKYAYTTKIKSAVDTFLKKIEEKDMHAKMLSSIQSNESTRAEIHKQLQGVKRILEDGKLAREFRKKIIALDMMKDAKIRIRQVRSKITKELSPSKNKGAMTSLEVQQLMMKMNITIQHLQSDVKTELDNIISDVIVENAKNIIADYREHLHELIQNGILSDNEYTSNVGISGIGFLEMDIPNAQEIIDNYKYNEEYDTGETEWIENKNKKWYKPWTWFQESGHYQAIYAEREMVDYGTVENEFLTPVMQSFMENIESAQSAAQEEANKFKEFFLQQLAGLENALKKKVEENEKLTQNQNNIERRIEEEKEKIAWLESFLVRLKNVLEI